MIHFENLSKSFWVNGYRKVVIDDLTATLPTGASLALLGRNGAGKSTLLQMIAGTMRSDSGRITSDGSISWPVGFGGSFHQELTGKQNVRFLALQYRDASPILDTDDQLSIFLAGFEVIYKKVCARGERVILRDHAHSHFCTGPDIPERPTLKQIIAPHYPILSVVSVRHPLDSYLSMIDNKFTHFTPGTLDDYARRYLVFLDKYADEKFIKYEDFITDHDATMDVLCTQLDLPKSADIHDIAPSITLTGNSGRGGDKLKLRDRREVSTDIAAMCKSSKNYKSLCKQLDYST